MWVEWAFRRKGSSQNKVLLKSIHFSDQTTGEAGKLTAYKTNNGNRTVSGVKTKCKAVMNFIVICGSEGRYTWDKICI